jgi:hypothetical protein
VAAKCDITKSILNKVELKKWGFETDKAIDRAIAVDYLKYLGCNDISLKLCSDEIEDCNTFVEITCNIKVVDISYELPNGDVPNGLINFYLGVGDILGALGDLTYTWSYDTDVFDLIGDIHDPIVGFAFKGGKLPSAIVTPITVEVEDANGCKTTKTCYYIGGIMNCSPSFIPCVNPIGLIVSMRHDPCEKPKTLVVVVSSTATPEGIFSSEFSPEFA